MGMSRLEDEIPWKNSSLLNYCLVNNVNWEIDASEISGSPTDEKNNASKINAFDNENWRFPELNEVVADLKSCDDEIKLNAAAYLQHLAFKNDFVKSSARELKALESLIEMLSHPNHEVVRSALGALRNLSCGKTNDLNKMNIKDNDGVKVLVEVIKTSHDHSVIEMASGLLWNLSSCPVLKDEVLQESLDVMCNYLIMPLLCCISSDASQPPHKLTFSNFKHATGVIRNISSGNKESQQKLHQHGGLTTSMLSFVSWSSKHRDVDVKSIENCLCILRNLSYNFDEYFYVDIPLRSRSLGRKVDRKKSVFHSPTSSCFRSRRSSKHRKQSLKFSQTGDRLGSESGLHVLKLLMRSEVVGMLVQLLETHADNADICEAILGIIQNISIVNSQPTLSIVEALRKCQGFPVVVQNLTMNSDKVVVAASMVLKILSCDQINQDIIGRHVMDHVLNRPLPLRHENPYSVDTHESLSSAIFESLGTNVAFPRSVMITGGIKQLTNVVLSPTSFGIRASQLAAILLKKIWSFNEMHEDMRVRGLRKFDFMIEPPKKTSMESLDSCNNEMEGRSKKVRFVEIPSGEGTSGCHNPLPNMVPPVPNIHQSTIPTSASTLFTSNTLPKPCYSLSNIRSLNANFPNAFKASSSSSPCFSQYQRQANSNIFFPCCYTSRPIAMTSSLAHPPSTTPFANQVRHPLDSKMSADPNTSSSLPISPSSSSSSSSSSSHVTNTQIIAQTNKIFVPANSWV